MALKAQHSKEGYDYGGAQGLGDDMSNNRDFLSYNFEQQAQIIGDYYHVMNRDDLRDNPFYTHTYGYFYSQMLENYCR